jgi:biopolymer transport protein ExbD
MRKPARDVAGVNLGLIITPMLDMSFQILAFFIMTYHPSALEGHLPGTLAAAPAGSGPVTLQEIEALDERHMEFMEVVTVRVSTGGARRGQPDKVTVQRRSEPVPRPISDATMSWDTARRTLERQLREMRQEDETADVRIQADGDLRHEFVLHVYDACRNAGFTRIHFVPPPIDRQVKR